MSELVFKKNVADPVALVTLSIHIGSVGASGKDSVFLVGTAGKTFKATSLPDVDHITVLFTDAAGGLAGADVKLATTEAGLAIAGRGATLDLGTEIVIAADNTGHPEIWVEITDTIGAGTHANLSLSVVPLVATDTV